MGNLVAGQRQKQKFSVAIQTDAYQKLINNTLGDPERAKRFVASVTSAVAANAALQDCTAGSILAGALLGESLNLSPSPQLGQYYLVPFKNQLKDENGNKLWQVDENGKKVIDANGRWVPITETVASFVCGYKGFLQLALRSGQYKDIDVREVKEGEYLGKDPETAKPRFRFIEDDDAWEALPTVGYMAYFEYLNGFRKTMYWSKKKMLSHADKYSPAFKASEYEKYVSGDYNKKDEWKYSSYWYKDFDGMAKKTLLRQLISKWGVMSTEMQEITLKDGQMTHLDGNKIVAEDVVEMPDVVAPIAAADMKPEFKGTGKEINLDEL